MNSTLQELVAQRRGYKYLDKDGVSPYKHYKYDLKSRKDLFADLDTDVKKDCGAGWNLATVEWIADNCLKLDGVIAEFTIPTKAKIIVPKNSNGKFRTDIIRVRKVTPVESFFPFLKNLNSRLKEYRPKNPITGEIMPPIDKIKATMDQIRDQVGDQVGDQVWDQVGAQIRDQIRAQVGAQVGAQVWDQVLDQVLDQVWDQVGDQVLDQVGDQVWDQVRVCAYKAIADFFGLDCDHPAFELVRMGIIVVEVREKFKVFGKAGKYLGEF